jgi:hypothetical protein
MATITALEAEIRISAARLLASSKEKNDAEGKVITAQAQLSDVMSRLNASAEIVCELRGCVNGLLQVGQ